MVLRTCHLLGAEELDFGGLSPFSSILLVNIYILYCGLEYS